MAEEKAVVNFAPTRHLLLEFKPEKFQSFLDWKERWNRTNVSAERLGLLHYFQGQEEERQDPEVISFLLEVADGHLFASNFRRRDEFEYSSGYTKERQKIAQKAFSVLCAIFFKEEGREERPYWWWMLGKKDVFEKVLWFLRPCHNDGFRNIRFCLDPNLHQKEVFKRFLESFAKLGWEYKGRHFDLRENCDQKVEERLIASRPQFVAILNELGMLRWLNGDADGKRRDLDQASIDSLRYLAFESECYILPPFDVKGDGRSRRSPRDLEEAVLAGSVAAEILVIREICERKREQIGEEYRASMSERNKAFE